MITQIFDKKVTWNFPIVSASLNVRNFSAVKDLRTEHPCTWNSVPKAVYESHCKELICKRVSSLFIYILIRMGNQTMN